MRHPVTADTFFLYRFDEASASDNAADAGPGGYTLTQTGSPTVVAGVFANARQFGSGKFFSRYDGVTIIPAGVDIINELLAVSPLYWE